MTEADVPDVTAPEPTDGNDRGSWAGAEGWLEDRRTSAPAPPDRSVATGPANSTPERPLQVHTVHVDGRQGSTVAGALDALAAALRFPAYYGRNPDAFIECLSDLLVVGPEGGLGSQYGDRDGIAADGVVIEVDHPDAFLGDPQDRAQLIKLVDYALRRPAPAGSTKVPLVVVLAAPTDAAPDSPSPAG